VCDAGDAGDAEDASALDDLLDSLTDKSLLVGDTAADPARYRMLETVREYGRERLAQSGEEEVVRGRHAEYYLALAEEAKPFVEKPEPSWLDRLETEHDNLRAAMTLFAAEQGGESLDEAVRLAAALWTFWNVRGHFYEKRTWLVGLARRPSSPTAERVQLLNDAAVVVASEGDFAGARQMFTEMLAISRQSGDRRRISGALNGLTWLLSDPSIAGAQYDPVAARALAQESVAISRELSDRQDMVHSLFQLGSTARRLGDRDEARTYWLECRSLDRELGVKGGHVLRRLGDLALESGDLWAARDYFGTFLSECYEIGERWGVAWGLQGLGAVALARGEPERAARLLGAASAVRDAVDFSLSEEERASYEALRNTLQEALNESAFRAAWAQGRAMALEQAIEYALSGGTDGDLRAPP
jgi:tetratricopeptide (TPR) repeat protein